MFFFPGCIINYKVLYISVSLLNFALTTFFNDKLHIGFAARIRARRRQGVSFLKKVMERDAGREVGYCAREEFRTGERMILVSLVRWGEQLIRRISYQGDEVSLKAKKNGGRASVRTGTPREGAHPSHWKTHKFQFSPGDQRPSSATCAPYIDLRAFQRPAYPARPRNKHWENPLYLSKYFSLFSTSAMTLHELESYLPRLNFATITFKLHEIIYRYSSLSL